MWVKYKGHGSLVEEFNGKKYAFDAKRRIQNIPVEVYNHIQTIGHPEVMYLTFCEEKYLEEIAELKKEIARLKYPPIGKPNE